MAIGLYVSPLLLDLHYTLFVVHVIPYMFILSILTVTCFGASLSVGERTVIAMWDFIYWTGKLGCLALIGLVVLIIILATGAGV